MPIQKTLAIISDTHSCHRELDIPAGDILLHAGDWSFQSRSMAAVEDFGDWLRELNFKHKILVQGNHDSYLDRDPSLTRLTRGAILLHNQGIKIEGGLRIWGVPWAWHPEARAEAAAMIPDGIDVLISHVPPLGVLDAEPGAEHHSGCPALLAAVKRVRPRLHVFGHIHAGHGMVEIDGTLHVNAAMLDDGGIERQPIMLRMTAEKPVKASR